MADCTWKKSPMAFFRPPSVAASRRGRSLQHPERPRGALALATGLAVVAAAGCQLAPLGTADRAAAPVERALAGPRRPPASRPLEVDVVFLRHEPHDPLLGNDLWSLVDEQAIDEQTRRQLSANGLRGGVVIGDVPAPLASRLAEAAAEPTLDAPGTLRVLQLLPGRRAEIVATTLRPDLIVLENDGESVRGTTYHDASGVVAVRAWPAADGRMRIEAVPELKHGPSRRTWVGEEGAFRLETGQSSHRLDRLAVTVDLPPHGLLVIGCRPDAPSSIGEAILQERPADAVASRQLLVISPRAAAVDPVFATATTGDADTFTR